VGRYQKGKTSLDFTEARDSEWQWHQLSHMQVYTSLQTDNHASTPPGHHSVFLQAGCPSCHPTNSVKADRMNENERKINKQNKQVCVQPCPAAANTALPAFAAEHRAAAVCYCSSVACNWAVS